MSNKVDREVTELLLKNALEEYVDKSSEKFIEEYKDTEPQYSEKHKRRMRKLFKKSGSGAALKKVIGRAAMVVLAVFISAMVALQVEAIRVRVENWYYEITGEAIHIGNSIEVLPGYSETETPIYVLSDDFVQKYNFSVSQEIEERYVTSKYENLTEKYIIIRQYNEERDMHIDNKNTKVEKLFIAGKEIVIVNHGNETTLVWKEGDVQILCFTNFNNEKFHEIVENLVIINDKNSSL